MNGGRTGHKRGENGARTGGERSANGAARIHFYFCCAPASACALCENERARATPFQADAKARMSVVYRARPSLPARVVPRSF